jgi:hypothetical protein
VGAVWVVLLSCWLSGVASLLLAGFGAAELLVSSLLEEMLLVGSFSEAAIEDEVGGTLCGFGTEEACIAVLSSVSIGGAVISTEQAVNAKISSPAKSVVFFIG